VKIKQLSANDLGNALDDIELMKSHTIM